MPAGPDELLALLGAAGARWMVYGPQTDQGAGPIEVVGSFGAVEAEYACIRQRVGLLHLPQRGVLELRGTEVRGFLHRLLTQDVESMTGGQSRRAFLLNNKGRIEADLFVHHGDVSTWLEGDVFDLPVVAAALEAKLFGEDVVIEDLVGQRVCLALHGPASAELLVKVAEDGQAARRAAELPGTHHVVGIGRSAVTVCRRDTCGVPGLVLFVPTEAAAGVLASLLEAAGFEPGMPDPAVDPVAAADAAARRRGSMRGRPIGWEAFNWARIEAGSPIFHVDFGPDSIPAETGPGLFDEAVSMNKGCYVGQEIVARMHNLGHPKRLLVGFEAGAGQLPVAGSQVCSATGGAAEVIGGVTSSTISVLHGHRAVGFAVMKWGRHEPGTEVLIPVDGKLVPARLGPLGLASQDSAGSG